ncbi:MAG: DUF4261 domain-containing protein [Pseudomonadales bacterium]|nr:DUF4261 domain-containing protein [Pseudomonadales bacterium]
MALFGFIFILGATLLIYVISSTQKASSQADVEDLSNLDLRTVEQAVTGLGDGGWMFAVVFLDGIEGLSIDRVRDYLASKWPTHHAIGPIDTKGIQKTFSTLGANFSYELTATYSTSNTLQGACKHHYYWPDAEESIQRHRLSMVIGVRLDGGPLAYSLALSQAVGALVATCKEATGVLWSAGNQVISRQNILQNFTASLDEEVPINLWIACHTYRDEAGRTMGYTQGLINFGQVDFEAIDAPESPEILRSRLMSLMGYSALNCNKILDGDTYGSDRFEEIQLEEKPSKIGCKGSSLRLNYINQSPSDRH